MKQFLQIHNTDCNKRTIFRTFLQWENEKLKRRDAEALSFYFEHGKHGRNEIRTLRCLGLSRKLFAKAHQAKASSDDDQKIYSRKLIFKRRDAKAQRLRAP